jgi:general stress protein YciG
MNFVDAIILDLIALHVFTHLLNTLYDEARQMGDDSNKGLVSGDEEVRERVAKKGGEARAQDKEGLSEAGRKGGQHQKLVIIAASSCCFTQFF